MKLKKYDLTVRMIARKGVPSIRINGKNGVFAMNGTLATALKLKKGACVSMMQDEDNPRDWYIMPDKAGFVLRGNRCGLAFNSAVTAVDFLDSLNYDKRSSHSFVVSEVKLDGMYAVITAMVGSKNGLK